MYIEIPKTDKDRCERLAELRKLIREKRAELHALIIEESEISAACFEEYKKVRPECMRQTFVI